MFAGPPPFEAPDRWPKEKVLDWAEKSAAWAEAFFKSGSGDAVIATASLHLDETSPHLHVLAAPLVRDSKGAKFAWKQIRRKAASAVAGERVTNWHRHGEIIQDAYHAKVGSQFGLGRGERGSKRRHAEPDRVAGLQTRVRGTERLARERVAAAERETAARVAAAEKAAAAKIKAAEKKAGAEIEKAAGAERDARRRVEAAEGRVSETERTAAEAERRAAASEGKADDEFRLRSAIKAKLDREKSTRSAMLRRVGADDRTRQRAAAEDRAPASTPVTDRFQKPDRGGRGGSGR